VPTYGYCCPKCALEFEVWQRMSDDPVAACPTCGTASRRLFFPAGIVFKGSGFYKTDSRSASAGGSTSSDSSSSATKKTGGSDSNGASPKTNTKPESKSKPAAAD